MNEIKTKKKLPELESGMFGKMNSGESFVVVRCAVTDMLYLVYDDGRCDFAEAYDEYGENTDDGFYITELWAMFIPCFNALRDGFGLPIFKRT